MNIFQRTILVILTMTLIPAVHANWTPPTQRAEYDPDRIPAANKELPVTPFSGPHQKALTSPYPGTEVLRTPVLDSAYPWNIKLAGYQPVEHTNPTFIGPDRPPYAQSERVQEVIDAHELGGIKSFYVIQHGGTELRPLNPMGRTGLSGRGTLGHWGANPAVDALLIRQNPKTAKLEIFLIWRRADQMHALPGGMQEDDELTTALKKEVKEEVGAAIAEILPKKTKAIVYRGYVDDPRNTDNAWMETTAFALFFNQDEAKKMPVKLTPTDTDEVDAGKGGWFPLMPLLNPADDSQKLYGSHGQIIQRLKSPDMRKILEPLGLFLEG